MAGGGRRENRTPRQRQRDRSVDEWGGSSKDGPQAESIEESHSRSAEHDGLGEAGLAGFLVLAIHVFRGLRKRQHGFVDEDMVAVLERS